MKFYSVVLRKKVEIPKSNVKKVVKKGHYFLVGTYKAKGSTYKAWMVTSKDNYKKF